MLHNYSRLAFVLFLFSVNVCLTLCSPQPAPAPPQTQPQAPPGDRHLAELPPSWDGAEGERLSTDTSLKPSPIQATLTVLQGVKLELLGARKQP